MAFRYHRNHSMKESIVSEQPQGEQEDPSVLVAARRAKL
jgi:hypothetical protein